mmetsp:Transcript_388/g.2976  ORF Transcript_388/g.2976 Transcript_388/m.2976 type:complete len:244 (-) Transcript_388:421-1152(-)
MSRTVKHHDGDIINFFLQGKGNSSDVLLHCITKINEPSSFLLHGKLVHVHDWSWVIECPFRSNSNYRQGSVSAKSSKPCAIQRIHRDIHGISRTVSNTFAIEKHGRFIFFSFTNDHSPTHGNKAENMSHCIHCGLVGTLLITLAQPSRTCEGSSFCDSHEIQGQIPGNTSIVWSTNTRHMGIVIFDGTAAGSNGRSCVHGCTCRPQFCSSFRMCRCLVGSTGFVITVRFDPSFLVRWQSQSKH